MSVRIFIILHKKYINCVFRYYNKGEIKHFENIECEWPLFYIYMIIDGVFKSLPDQIQEYQDLLKERIMLDHNGGKLTLYETTFKLTHFPDFKFLVRKAI